MNNKNVNRKQIPNSESDVLREIKYLKPTDTFSFTCTQCGQCCRNLSESVVLEPYDLYRLARHLRQSGEAINGIEDVIERYADIAMLGEVGYPIIVFKTVGENRQCVFLKDNRCSIQDAKPRVCRTYPIGLWPNDTLDGFDYLMASQKKAHFSGAEYRVSDWVDANTSVEEKAIILADAQATKQLALTLNKLKRNGAISERVFQQIIIFKFLYFDLDEPYLQQFKRNMTLLYKAVVE